jgi:hypothetical protein
MEGLIAILGVRRRSRSRRGINLYATVAILGLVSRFKWVELPPQFAIFNNDIVIGVAVLLYVIEFFADKIPYLDTAWDLVHTAIRPLGGAFVAVASVGDASPAAQGAGGAAWAARWRRKSPDERLVHVPRPTPAPSRSRTGS